MSLAEAFQNILFGPAPTSDNMGNQMADQLGEDNPFSIMLRRYRGVPTMNMINAATGYDLQNRGQKLSENQFDAQTYIPTQDMANGITPDNNQGFIVTPGQRRYINDIQQAMTQQNAINERTKYNTAVDAAMKYLQGIPGFDPNNPAFLALNPDTRGMFTPEQVGNATLGMANTAYQAPQLKEQQQQMSDFYDQFVNSMIPEAQRQNFMLPNVKQYWMSHPDEFDKYIQQFMPQAPKPMDPLDAELKKAQIAKYYHDAGAPYGRGGGGSNPSGGQYNDPSKAKVTSNLIREYTTTHPTAAARYKNGEWSQADESDFRNWILKTKGNVAWRNYMYETTGDPSILGVKTPKGYNAEAWNAADRLVIQSGGIARAIRSAGANTNQAVIQALVDRYNMVNGTSWTISDWKNALKNGYEVPHRR